MKLNSQICTTVEQSERLLGLGLKKETADIVHYFSQSLAQDWLLYHLQMVKLRKIYKVLKSLRGVCTGLLEMRLQDRYSCEFHLYEDEDAYKKIIDLIEWQIKEGYFNKEYLA